EGRRRRRALVGQQPTLAPDAARVPREVPVAADDAMAWNDQADRVARVRQTDRADRPRASEDLGELSVGHRPAGRHPPAGLPDLLLEEGAAAGDTDFVERLEVSGEVRAHSCRVPVGITASLQDDAGESRADPRTLSRPRERKGERAQRLVSRDDGQRAERRPNVIDPEPSHIRSATLPDARW